MTRQYTRREKNRSNTVIRKIITNETKNKFGHTQHAKYKTIKEIKNKVNSKDLIIVKPTNIKPY